MPWKDYFKLKEFGLSYSRPQDFVTLQHGPPIVYVIWAALWLAYHFIWILLEAYWSSTHYSSPGKWIFLLTNLSYLALATFAFMDFIVCVFVFCLRTEIVRGEVKYLPWYIKIQWIAMNVCAHAALQVTVIYWIFLAHSTKASSINKHGINLLYILLVICVSAKPIKFQHVYQAALSSLFYVIVNAIYFGASGDILYPFLDWTKPTKAFGLSIAYIFVSTPLSFLLLFGLHKLKLYIYEKILRSFNRQQTLSAKEDEALETIKFENGHV